MSELANDLMIKRAEAYEAKEEAKRALEEATSALRKVELDVLDAMLDAGLASISNNTTMAYLSEKKNWKIPRDPENYDAFYEWVTDKYGVDTAKSIFTPNSSKLNAFLKEIASDEGPEAVTGIPGIHEPSVFTQIRFRKKA